MAFGFRETLFGAGALVVGAGIGAASSSEHRARNGAIGGVVGLLAAGANVLRELSNWKDAGGARRLRGACTPGTITDVNGPDQGKP